MHGTPKSTVSPVVVAFPDGPTPVGPVVLVGQPEVREEPQQGRVVGERARASGAHPLAPDVGHGQHDLAVELVAGRRQAGWRLAHRPSVAEGADPHVARRVGRRAVVVGRADREPVRLRLRPVTRGLVEAPVRGVGRGAWLVRRHERQADRRRAHRPRIRVVHGLPVGGLVVVRARVDGAPGVDESRVPAEEVIRGTGVARPGDEVALRGVCGAVVAGGVAFEQRLVAAVRVHAVDVAAARPGAHECDLGAVRIPVRRGVVRRMVREVHL